MKKLLFVALLYVSTATFAQQSSAEYQSALGVKFAAGVAATYKQFITPTNAAEFQTMFFKQGIRLGGLYEFHFYNIQGVPGLAWYVGPGAHLGFWRSKYKTEHNSAIDLGIDGVIGLDYKISGTPINLSLDWQPSYSVVGDSGFEPQFGGIAIRYILR